MLTIRFNRTGKKNRASFRVALQEKTQAPGRKHVELLGSYDPHSKVAVLKSERILHWIGQGAEVSDSVHNLLVREGVLKDGKKRAIKMEKPAVKEEETTAEEAKAEASAEEKTEEKPEKKTEGTKSE